MLGLWRLPWRQSVSHRSTKTKMRFSSTIAGFAIHVRMAATNHWPVAIAFGSTSEVGLSAAISYGYTSGFFLQLIATIRIQLDIKDCGKKRHPFVPSRTSISTTMTSMERDLMPGKCQMISLMYATKAFPNNNMALRFLNGCGCLTNVPWASKPLPYNLGIPIETHRNLWKCMRYVICVVFTQTCQW